MSSSVEVIIKVPRKVGILLPFSRFPD